MRSHRHKRLLWVSIVTIVIEAVGLSAVVFYLIRQNFFPTVTEPRWGVTFSEIYAEELGLDWRETYRAALDDLGVRAFRLSAYWPRIEPIPGKFQYADLDWMLDEAVKRDAKVVLAVGRRLPRWPECHVPKWAKDLPEAEVQLRILNHIRHVVEHVKTRKAVVAWQVENEPLLNVFGICPPSDKAFLEREVALVRSLDRRPIILTESGELSSWTRLTGLADTIGISMYRVVWNKYLGYFYYPLTPRSYKKRAEVVGALGPSVIVTELQTEAWGRGKPLQESPVDEQYRSMNPKRFRSTVEFARRTGLPEVYLWGVEWWYWLMTAKGEPAMWDVARQIFSRR